MSIVALIVGTPEIPVGVKLFAQGKVTIFDYASGMRSRPFVVLADEQQPSKTLLCGMMGDEGAQVFSLYHVGEVVAVSGEYMATTSLAGYPSMPLLRDCHVADAEENVVRPTSSGKDGQAKSGGSQSIPADRTTAPEVVTPDTLYRFPKLYQGRRIQFVGWGEALVQTAKEAHMESPDCKYVLVFPPGGFGCTFTIPEQVNPFGISEEDNDLTCTVKGVTDVVYLLIHCELSPSSYRKMKDREYELETGKSPYAQPPKKDSVKTRYGRRWFAEHPGGYEIWQLAPQ